MHVRQYIDWRQNSQVRANRERALFSNMWNCGREWGYTGGVHGFSERGRRDVYTEDEMLAAVYEVADQPLRDALDLTYFTGKRPSKTLKLSESDIHEGVIHIMQGKTKRRQRTQIIGRLKEVIGRIMLRKESYRTMRKVVSLCLIVNEKGERFGSDALRSRFDHARANAVKAVPAKLKDIDNALMRSVVTGAH